jgi:DNA polymerase IV
LRKIIHCDCDSFYASVEIRDDPSLRDKPLAVGGSADQRGVVATCSYAARAYGVRSAMPMGQALRLCPQLVVVRPNMAKYRDVSQQIHEVFARYTTIIEPLSLDEAFLDVSDCTACRGSATRIAQEIRGEVRDRLGITLSAGIAPNKFIAKIASDWNKPDGQLTVTPDQVDVFVAALPVEKLFGVGSVTARRMHERGLVTCADLRTLTLPELTGLFGKFGIALHQLCRGIDERPVRTSRARKSVSVERTYSRDLPDLTTCRNELDSLVGDLEERIHRAEVAGRVEQCFVKVRFNGFETTTAGRASRRAEPATFGELLEVAWARGQRPVRLLGIGVRLDQPAVDRQLGLFEASAPAN